MKGNQMAKIIKKPPFFVGLSPPGKALRKKAGFLSCLPEAARPLGSGQHEKYAYILFDNDWCIAFDSSLQTTKER
jgi:hypothetical protein